MPNTIDLKTLAAGADHHGQLELIRLGADEQPVIFFTSEVVSVKVHYCAEDEIRGYVQCNEPDCVLCNIGRKQDQRYLLVAYDPIQKNIGVLPISPSMQPFALLPQLLEVLERPSDRLVVFIRRENSTKFIVTTSPLADNTDAGESQVKAFLERFEAGTIDLASVYHRFSNKQLVAVPAITEMMHLKGIASDDAG